MIRFPITPWYHRGRRRFAAKVNAAWRSSTTVAGDAYPMVLSMGSRPFRWYSHKLDTHPILTKCVTAGLIASVGNISAQKITHHRQQQQNNDEEEHFSVDWTSVGRFSLLNAIYVAPVLHHWYRFLDRAVPGNTMKAVWKRVFYDEFVFAPVYLSGFLASLWRSEGTEWNQVQDMLGNEMPSILVAQWALWIPTMALTFRYAAVKYQVLVINLVGVVWQTFLSLAANQATHTTDTTTAHERPCGQGKSSQQQQSGSIFTRLKKPLLPPIVVEDKMLEFLA